MPGQIIPGDKRTLHKRVVEAVAGMIYAMELDDASSQKVWAYRKAAWAIEDTPQDLGLIYRALGRKGSESLENVWQRLPDVIQDLLDELLGNPPAALTRATSGRLPGTAPLEGH